MDALGPLAAMIAFAGLAIYSIRRGYAPIGRGRRWFGAHRIRRADYPIAFWLIVAAYSAVAVFCAWTFFQLLQPR